MREGRYESEGGRNIGTAITFLLIGLGAGAVVGMLFAPKTGRQMRRDLRRGYENARETLDEFFRSQLRSRQRKRIQAACLDMWEPFRLSIEHWAPQCKIVYDKFHILQHANAAIDEVRKAEFFRQGPKKRGLIKGKKWLLLSRWKNLTQVHRGELNHLFQMNRRVFKAYLLKESLERLILASTHVLASNQVASASPIPATSSRGGLWAMT